jgi:Spy/CpxP family protein refolding chaperone
MKKVLFSLLVTAFIGTAAVAQDQTTKPQEQQKTPQEKAEWERKIKEELKLTPDQVTKFDAVSKEYGPKMEAIEKDATLTADVQKERKMALKKEKEARLFEFLTPEQQTKYKELMEKKKKDTAKS